MMNYARFISAVLVLIFTTSPTTSQASDPDKLLWGDVHLHTNLSWDAYYMGNRTADLETAYRFAKGMPVVHPFHRAKVRINRPLDFLAVTDHAEFLGLPHNAIDVQSDSAKTRLGRHLTNIYEQGGPGATALVTMIVAFQTSQAATASSEDGDAASRFPPPPPQVTDEFVSWIMENPDIWDEFFDQDVMTTAWDMILGAADRHYQPGKFTTLVGWEYSPQANGGNLHRVVLTPASGASMKSIKPFSFMDDDDPEGLWKWLENIQRTTGVDFVAIPHNSNLSKGTMFSDKRLNGELIDAVYAERRARWETVAEVTQMKGDSETHPILSPDDEFADFEFFAHQLASFKDDIKVPPVTEADYLRSALKKGLKLGNQLGVNPFKLGMIGSTDGHNALSSVEEDNFLGKFGEGTTPEEAPKPVGDFSGYTNWDFSSSGLAAVWATENTREEIFAAFRRREVYGTTGPRIKLRFFGGYDYGNKDLNAKSLANIGYKKGVPMGSDLFAANGPLDKTPNFLIQAAKDPASANLDRIQVVKGWLDNDGKAKEKVFNVAWAGNRQIDKNGRLPSVGNTVDVKTARYSNSIGEAELATIWTDPEFDPDQSAFYYVRVLEIPTPRQSLYDAVALQVTHPDAFPLTIQERAYSSPIWYVPARKIKK